MKHIYFFLYISLLINFIAPINKNNPLTASYDKNTEKNFSTIFSSIIDNIMKHSDETEILPLINTLKEDKKKTYEHLRFFFSFQELFTVKDMLYSLLEKIPVFIDKIINAILSKDLEKFISIYKTNIAHMESIQEYFTLKNIDSAKIHKYVSNLLIEDYLKKKNNQKLKEKFSNERSQKYPQEILIFFLMHEELINAKSILKKLNLDLKISEIIELLYNDLIIISKEDAKKFLIDSIKLLNSKNNILIPSFLFFKTLLEDSELFDTIFDDTLYNLYFNTIQSYLIEERKKKLYTKRSNNSSKGDPYFVYYDFFIKEKKVNIYFHGDLINLNSLNKLITNFKINFYEKNYLIIPFYNSFLRKKEKKYIISDLFALIFSLRNILTNKPFFIIPLFIPELNYEYDSKSYSFISAYLAEEDQLVNSSYGGFDLLYSHLKSFKDFHSLDNKHLIEKSFFIEPRYTKNANQIYADPLFFDKYINNQSVVGGERNFKTFLENSPMPLYGLLNPDSTIAYYDLSSDNPLSQNHFLLKIPFKPDYLKDFGRIFSFNEFSEDKKDQGYMGIKDHLIKIVVHKNRIDFQNSISLKEEALEAAPTAETVALANPTQPENTGAQQQSIYNNPVENIALENPPILGV